MLVPDASSLAALMSDIWAWLAGKYDLPGDQQVAQGRARLSCPDRRHPFSFAVVGVDARITSPAAWLRT
jgi:hypothetical protein